MRKLLSNTNKFKYTWIKAVSRSFNSLRRQRAALLSQAVCTV